MSYRGAVASSKVDEFRAIVRSISLEQCATIAGVLHSTLDSRSTQDPINKKKIVDCKAFTDGLLSVRQVRQKFTPADLADIYNDANDRELAGLDIDELVDFIQKSMGKARVLALKLRNALAKEYNSVDGYRKAFLASCNPTTKICDKDRFTQFAEDYLRMTVTDNDAMGMYSLFDMNGDGKVSLDDFCGFMSGRSTEATGILNSGNGDVIVDIQISNTPQQDSDLMRAGYTQVIPTELGGQETKYDVSTQGSFGKGESIWVWRRKQGTCSGRLKPIVDIQLGENAATSSMVVAGYTAVKGSLAGMKLWIRRAVNSTDEREAIISLQISLGNMKNPSDNIWIKPGVDWIRVDANFSKSGLFGLVMRNVDAFLWMLPSQVRSIEAPGLQGMLRAAGGLSEEKRLEKICKIARTAIRANVPAVQMRNVCNPIDVSNFTGKNADPASVGSEENTASSAAAVQRGRPQGMRAFDFSNLYHDYDQTLAGKMNSQKLYKLLKHSGVWLEPDEVNYMFRYMDVSINYLVSREEYAKCLSLTDFEIDECVELMRSKLLPSHRTGTANNDARDARILAQVFKLINTDGDGIISLAEFMHLMAALEIYVTEEEARKILHMMDVDGDDRVEENDFVAFIKHDSETHINRAHHLRETANILRRWLNRGNTSSMDTTQAVENSKQWEELKTRYQKGRGGTFPNFLDADDILSTCAYLGNCTSPVGSRELVLMIAPEQNGRITQQDLMNFMGRNIRSYGELAALCERDIMKPLFDLYKAFQKAVELEDPNAQVLEADYLRMRKEVVQEVQNTAVQAGGTSGTVSNAANGEGYVHDVVSVLQLKGGIEAAMRRYKEFDGRAPSTEEWADLACLTGSAVAEEDVYGVNVSKFMEKILPVVAGGLVDRNITSGTPASLDVLVKEISRLIRAEALEAGGGTKLDYRASFNIINKDGDEVLSIDEFRSNLIRLQLSHLCPEGELPKLLRLFDTSNKGYITFDDFMGFVNKYKGLAEEGGFVQEIEIEQDDPAKMSDTPPLAITRNADCDYVIWFIWRQCCRLEPGDPECIITELESACQETELTQSEGSISIKELWNLLFELKIQTSNNISKHVFEKGVRYLLIDSRGKRAAFDNDQPDGQIDYSALCRYVVRMGRGQAAMRDERNAANKVLYKRLSGELRQFLLNLSATEFASGYTPRFASPQVEDDKQKRIEKVFRRMDSDGDGKLSPAEFKGGLKRLGYKDEKLWTRAVVMLFFAEVDTNNDGLISLEELSKLFSPEDPRANRNNSKLTLAEPSFGRDGNGNNGDDADDIFGGHKGAFAESELFFKAFTTLKEMVPIEDGQQPNVAIASAIRRFFSKNDAQGKGQVSEERFRAFLRRSGMLDRLTSGELRRLAEALRRRNGSSGTSIDYEKFITNLDNANVNGPSSRADMVLLRLRDAALNSAGSGRPFYGLCALADPSNSGRLTKEELLLTCKMMGCALSAQDLDTLRAYTPDTCFGKDGTVDYKEINYVINNEQPNNSDLFSMGPASFTRQGPTDNRYASATTYNNTPRLAASTPFAQTPAQSAGRMNATYSTPRGEFDRLASTPLHSALPNRQVAAAAYDERDLTVVADRIRSGLAACRDTLPRVFESDDPRGDGVVHTRVFVRATDEIGLMLTNGDVSIIQAAFPGGVDRIDYEALWRYVQSNNTSSSRAAAPGTAARGSSTRGFAREPKYLNARTLSRLAECRADGRDPRDLFEAYDLDRTGLVDAWRFREMLQRLNLFDNDAFIEIALTDFAALRERDMISYDDFCRVLETAEGSSGRVVNIRGSSTGIKSALRTDTRDPLDSANVEQWLTRAASPKQRREFSDVYDSLKSFKTMQTEREIPIALDEGSDFDRSYHRDSNNDRYESADVRDSREGYLRPPKASDSRDFGRSARTPSNRYGSASYGSTENLRNSSSYTRGGNSPKGSLLPASSSPSRVGSKMWGSHTSLDLKGVAPRVEPGLWVCAVCLYTENGSSQDTCSICDSANYAKRPDFVVKEQCGNCTFLNGQYSGACEMCGEPMKGGRSGHTEAKADRERSSTPNRRY